MIKPFNLEIKTPCSENFNQFTATQKGGFCQSCEKEVIDFTKMNAQDIKTYFKNKSNQNTCGRFNSNQLKTYNQAPKQEKKLSFISTIGLACLSFFSFSTLQAQDIKKQTPNTKTDDSKFTVKQQEKEFFVKGTVFDESYPLPGASVILQGTTKGVQTDFDGNFKFPDKLKKGDVLVFTYVGMNSQKVVITDKHTAYNITLQVDMTATECVLMGKVAVKEVYKSKKN
ncbi:carboxypeptidase-like regulatory domain-containing protein [uncultured Psychroserpens sp.]|uniref:carboxypeptidase-like regulatory domain-containing protein n=1 Tax=uncultured Psychroserpens sp. TaxID=255436 RepID=UPI002606057F|nr:carboxypeptidase-like regulatory domain-containing protein [uncultured Psychroserpens sp.]